MLVRNRKRLLEIFFVSRFLNKMQEQILASQLHSSLTYKSPRPVTFDTTDFEIVALVRSCFLIIFICCIGG